MSELENQLQKFSEAGALKNVILHNVEENEETNKNIIKKIQEIIVKAEVEISDICIVDAYRIGEKNENKVRPVNKESQIQIKARRKISNFTKF